MLSNSLPLKNPGNYKTYLLKSCYCRFIDWFLIWMEEFWINWVLWSPVCHGYGCGICLSSSCWLISSHFFSPFVKDNVLYFPILFWEFFFMLHLDYSCLSYFLSRVNFSDFSVWESPFAGLLSWLGHMIVNSAVLLLIKR